MNIQSALSSWKTYLSLGSLAVLLTVGCSQNTLDLLGRSFIPNTMTAQDVTESAYHQVIVPGYRDFLRASQALNQAIDTFVAAPEQAENLEHLQTAWKTAAQAWVKTEAYQFGPATEDRLRQNIAFWPRRPQHIQGVLAGTETIQIEQLGTSRKGLPVMEYLLFHEADALASARGTRHRQYLNELGDDLVTQAEILVSEWDGGNYAQNYLNSSNAQNMQLNQWVVLLENIKNKRLGDPAGLLGSAATGPDGLEAPDSDYSLALVEAALEGFAESYALEGLSLQSNVPDTAEYMIALGHRPVQQQIAQQLSLVRAHLQQLQPSLARALAEKPDQVEVAYEDIKTLLRYVKVDLANALNQTVNFTDNDGD